MQNALGRGIVMSAPWLMKTLSVLGTAAMFLVGGSIILHGLPAVHGWVVNTLLEGLAGVVVGAIVFCGLYVLQKIRGRHSQA
jgi:predicted DNA repair protein MutK